jgi:hypothetical protein
MTANEQISFPMPGNGPILNAWQAITDRYCIENPAMVVPLRLISLPIVEGALETSSD